MADPLVIFLLMGVVCAVAGYMIGFLVGSASRKPPPPATDDQGWITPTISASVPPGWAVKISDEGRTVEVRKLDESETAA